MEGVISGIVFCRVGWYFTLQKSVQDIVRTGFCLQKSVQDIVRAGFCLQKLVQKLGLGDAYPSNLDELGGAIT